MSRVREEHRRVVEESLGVPILPGFMVHHKDGNPKNNCIDNLQVMETGEHIKLHHCTSFEPDALERVLVQCPE